MKKIRRKRQQDLFARLGRHMEICLDSFKPRRLRTRSARYAAALAESLGLIERPGVVLGVAVASGCNGTTGIT